MKRSHAIMAAIAASAVANEAFARAGGGQGYQPSAPSRPISTPRSRSSSPSYSSLHRSDSPSSYYRNSTSSSDGGIGSVLVLIVVLVLITIIVLRIFNSNNDFSKIATPDSPDQDSTLGRIQKSDPLFQANEFKDRVNKAFISIQNAWSVGDLEPVRPFMTDGAFERLSLGLGELKRDRRQNRLDHPFVAGIQLRRFAPVGPFGILHVAIDANGTDVTTDEQGHVLTSSETNFTEIWTFIRKLTAVSSAGKRGLMESSCPACGSPLSSTCNVRCTNCRCVIKSGDHDWILSEITQASEFYADNSQSILAMAEASGITQEDPDFCGQTVEDTATVMFIRNIRAQNEGDAGFVHKCSSTDYYESLQKKLESPVPRDSQVAIGAVSVRRIWSNPQEQMVHCDVEVVWSSQRPTDAQPMNRRSTLHLMRDAKARSNLGVGVARCRGCGAPDDGKAANSCQYCGQVYNDSKQDWLLIGAQLS